MWLKKLRKENGGLTQTELADKLGIHLRTIQHWESGKSHISDRTLKRLAVIFGKTENELLQLKYPNLASEVVIPKNVSVENKDIVSVLNEISETLKIIAQKL